MGSGANCQQSTGGSKRFKSRAYFAREHLVKQHRLVLVQKLECSFEIHRNQHLKELSLH